MTPEPRKTETLEEIAERIVRRQLNVRATAGLSPTQVGLYHAVLSALRGRDERAANMCEQAAMLASPDGVIPADDPEHERLQRIVTILNSAAKAIREGK